MTFPQTLDKVWLWKTIIKAFLGHFQKMFFKVKSNKNYPSLKTSDFARAFPKE